MLLNFNFLGCITVLALSVLVIAAPIDGDTAPSLFSRGHTAQQPQLLPRTKRPTTKSSKPPGGPPPSYPDPTSEYREQNADPNREVPATCKKFTDCKCPAATGPGMRSTSCINGFCKCNDPTIHAVANNFMDAVAAVGNAGITKVVSNLMKGLATVKQVATTIIGAVLPPHLRAALRVAINALPNTGPSFLDDAAKKGLNKAAGLLQ